MKRDIIVEEVRRAREELMKRHGGLEGWIDHLQQMDHQRAEKKSKRATKKKQVGTGKGHAKSK